MNHFSLHLTKKIFVSLSVCLMACFALSSCKHNEPEPEFPSKKRKTIIVYMAGENSLAPYTAPDIQEMQDAAGDIPKDCNFIVYIDDHKYPQIIVMSEKNSEHTETLEERDSCDPDEFYNTLKDLTSRYPADSYGLVCWSHASGWVSKPKKTFGIDNNKNSYSSDAGTRLEIPDMRKQLERLNIRWDYILFDACFMQCIEVAYEMRNVTDYIIASPAEIPGEGAPYNLIMKGLCMDGQKAAEEIAKAYFDYHNQLFLNQHVQFTNGVVLSVIKTSELENLLQATKDILPDFYTQAYTFDTSNIQAYGPRTKIEEFTEYFDMGSAMNKFMSGPEYEKWSEQVRRTFISRSYTSQWGSAFYDVYPAITDENHLTVCSIFIPNHKYDYAGHNESIKETQWYHDYTRTQN